MGGAGLPVLVLTSDLDALGDVVTIQELIREELAIGGRTR